MPADLTHCVAEGLQRFRTAFQQPHPSCGERGRFLHLSRGRVHLLEAGEGPRTVLLLHGLGGLAQEILLPFVAFADRYRLIAIDRPGYGRTDPLPASEMGADRQAEWLAEVLKCLGIRQPILVAHSISAPIALLAKADIGGMLLLAPFCRMTMPRPRPVLRLANAPVLGRLVRRWLLPIIAPRLAGHCLRRAFEPDPVPSYFADFPVGLAAQASAVQAMAAELRGFNRAAAILSRRAAAVRRRTIVIAGEKDAIARADHHAAWLADQLPACRLVRLPGAGHMVHHVSPAAAATALSELCESDVPRRYFSSAS
jgi:pimeloyl-ACP methyl ester carboxylesterase